MNDIKWSSIDDYLFVKLVGELLGRLGFVDIDYQGDGPDGGVDIFATELVPFAIQGRTPFRWAVQCKFSVDGVNGSVNDREIRDVEGILRSDRYLAQEPRGYMLITNRRIVQNVVERLRGVDRRSQYRAARIDGAELQSLLSDHPEVLPRYFGRISDSEVLGRPQLIVTALASGFSGKTLARVGMEVRVRESDALRAVTAYGIIDTGAEMTCIPREVADQLAAPVVGTIAVQTPAQIMTVPLVRVDLVIERLLFSDVTVVATDVKYVLLGMDMLKGLSVHIEPSGAIVVYGKPGE